MTIKFGKFGNFANFIVRNFVVIWEAPMGCQEMSSWSGRPSGKARGVKVGCAILSLLKIPLSLKTTFLLV